MDQCYRSLHTELAPLLDQINCGPPKAITPVSGGCINRCFKVTAADKREFFFKTHKNPPPGFFQAEADGLRAIADTHCIRVPQVYALSEQGLLLEYLAPSPADNSFWQQLGENLASLHQTPAPCFGFQHNNFCGLTPQPNDMTDNGFDFFRQCRLMYQAELALSNHKLRQADYDRVEQLCQRLHEWIPEQPPTLIHGDLWSGNIYCSAGEPVLIDPAAHWGWAEADIAMTFLFTSFSKVFYQSYYNNLRPKEGWQQRLELYNLYHLLNHLNLFGTSYRPPVREAIRRYVL
ncbi:MAG: fructosamine kinase family protein [Motiliproteus sp.]